MSDENKKDKFADQDWSKNKKQQARAPHEEQTSSTDEWKATKLCEFMHFFKQKRSNSLQVYLEDPFFKDGRWLTSGKLRFVLTRFQEPKNQTNIIKLTAAETAALILYLQKGLQLAIDKELELQQQKRRDTQ